MNDAVRSHNEHSCTPRRRACAASTVLHRSACPPRRPVPAAASRRPRVHVARRRSASPRISPRTPLMPAPTTRPSAAVRPRASTPSLGTHRDSSRTRGIRANVLVHPFRDRRRRAPECAPPTRDVHARTRDRSHPVAMRAPFPLERIVAQRIAARVQMDVPDRPRYMTRIAADPLRLGKRLPLERSAVVGSPTSRACAKRPQDLREDAQRARALDAREQMNVIGHQRAGNDVEAHAQARP